MSHDPANAEQRSRAASKAARSKGSTELGDVKQQLRDIADDVLEGTVDKGIASVAAQVLGVYIRACSQARKIREQDELLERLAALEQATQTNGSGTWSRACGPKPSRRKGSAPARGIIVGPSYGPRRPSRRP